MKWVKGLLVITFIFVSLFLTGCGSSDPYDENNFIDYSKPRFKWFEKGSSNDPQVIQNQTNPIVVPDIPTDRDYFIGTWNIEIFGRTKAENKPVYSIILDVMNDYDIIAIQEIRDSSGTVAAKLGEIPLMRVAISDRLGRSVSKEQYAFLYSGRVIPGTTRQYPDVGDRFEREPFMMDFTIEGYRFVMINVHVKPEDAEQEIRALQDVVDWAKKEYQNNNIIIAGDLNADCKYFDSFDIVMTEYDWLIDKTIDTTLNPNTDCAYDRIIVTEPNEKILWSGVDNLYDETRNSTMLLTAISDHYPVYFIYDRTEVTEVVTQ